MTKDECGHPNCEDMSVPVQKDQVWGERTDCPVCHGYVPNWDAAPNKDAWI
jgi:hypothetical protein